MTRIENARKELATVGQEVHLLRGILELLSWDRETKMPSSGAKLRADQSALLAGQIHRKLACERTGELIEVAMGEVPDDAADDEARRLQREWKRLHEQARRVPADLVERLSHATVITQGVWADARRLSDFKHLLPYLENVIELRKQWGQAMGFETSPYDAMIDAHEPGMTQEGLNPLFEALKNDLVPLVNAISHSSMKPRTEIVHRRFAIERQRLFGEVVAAAIGFDFTSGRMDETTHPFCTGIGPGDVRITTRYDEDDFVESFFGILHEAGHGLYEQGLDDKDFGSPLGMIQSMGMHESQSRMWENFVGRSYAFWKHFFPRAKQTYYRALGDIELDDFYFALNTVEPGHIRVDADEVTYNLHILLRYGIERDIFSGKLACRDLPEAWNTQFRSFFGKDVPNDKLGVLQDPHWACGAFGYFPTYTLGNLYAAQFFQAAQRDMPDLDEKFAEGDFRHFLGWLRTNIHRHGSRYLAHELVEKVTGRPPGHEPLVHYLRVKFERLYNLG